ncbi:MAG: segregation and condensation protein A [Parcubacteria bacterium C7867-004]|nr:MAG: segregation and condensation protein A [Parcubacteria bacterium C7867-004]
MEPERVVTNYTGFTIKAGSFEGPFELILDLIEKRKLSVNEITLAQVTDDYIAFVRGHEAFPMEDAAQFIGIAATLLLIKSKSLIPELELSTEEEEDVDDLKRRLILYEHVRTARQELARIFGQSVLVSAGDRAPEPIFAPSRDLTLPQLTEALAHALLVLEKVEEKLPEARIRSLVTIEEVMDTLLKRVQTAMNLSFKEFSKGSAEKVEVIVSFLALLELVKQGAVDALQHTAFEDIRITNTSAGVPRY